MHGAYYLVCMLPYARSSASKPKKIGRTRGAAASEGWSLSSRRNLLLGRDPLAKIIPHVAMDTHRALIAMGGVGARLLDHGQRVRFALKMGLWGPQWPRASAARADEKNVSMHLCSFGRFLLVLSPTFAFATSTALVPWISVKAQGVPFLSERPRPLWRVWVRSLRSLWHRTHTVFALCRMHTTCGMRLWRVTPRLRFTLS